MVAARKGGTTIDPFTISLIVSGAISVLSSWLSVSEANKKNAAVKQALADAQEAETEQIYANAEAVIVEVNRRKALAAQAQVEADNATQQMYIIIAAGILLAGIVLAFFGVRKSRNTRKVATTTP